MCKIRLISTVVALSLAATSTVALADHPGPNWIPKEKVISILKKDGYSQISEIEADDGHWEGEGIKHGKVYEFHVDPHSGKITKDQRESKD